MIKLLASAPTIESLKGIVAKYFYSKSIAFVLDSKGVLRVENGDRTLLNYKIVVKKNRARFELELN